MQSDYAKNFLKDVFGIDNAMYLSDYINDDIIEFARNNSKLVVRKNICLYNPRKGYHNLEPVIKECRDDIQWIPLKGFKPLEMAGVMCISKVYIDFGEHPGKDRIPREEAACGCNIITNRMGSAGNPEDVAIPEKFKFEDMQDVEHVLDCIYDLVDNYEERNKEYELYRNKIFNEKDMFISELEQVVELLAKEEEKRDLSMAENTHMAKTLDSIDEMLNYIKKCVGVAKECQNKENMQGVVSSLLKSDYYMQIIKEAIYKELL